MAEQPQEQCHPWGASATGSVLCPQWAGLVGSAQGLCRHQLDLILTAQLQGCLTREQAPWTTAPPRAGGQKAGLMEQQGGKMLRSSVPAALRIRPCAATAAAHTRPCSESCPSQTRPAQSPAPPATIAACCSHLAHPDPPGWITAESNPHPVRFVLHSHPSTGVKAMATSKQSLEQLLALSSRAKASHAAASQSWLEPGCPAGTQSCHLHPPQTHQSRLGQSARHSLAPCL